MEANSVIITSLQNNDKIICQSCENVMFFFDYSDIKSHLFSKDIYLCINMLISRLRIIHVEYKQVNFRENLYKYISIFHNDIKISVEDIIKFSNQEIDIVINIEKYDYVEFSKLFFSYKYLPQPVLSIRKFNWYKFLYQDRIYKPEIINFFKDDYNFKILIHHLSEPIQGYVFENIKVTFEEKHEYNYYLKLETEYKMMLIILEMWAMYTNYHIYTKSFYQNIDITNCTIIELSEKIIDENIKIEIYFEDEMTFLESRSLILYIDNSYVIDYENLKKTKIF